jgi:DNA repair exonuclease SbcCD ATPase subunit
MLNHKEVRVGLMTGLFILAAQGLWLNKASAEEKAKTMTIQTAATFDPYLRGLEKKLDKLCPDGKPESAECQKFMEETGNASCRASQDYKDATESLVKAKKYCVEAGFGANTKTCLEKANSCAKEEILSFSDHQKKLEEEGLELFDDESDYKDKCTHYGKKAYDEQVKDHRKTLKDNLKDAAEAKKKITTANEDFNKKTSELAKEDAKLQEEFRKASDQQAQEQAREQQQLLSRLGEMDRQKAEQHQRVGQLNVEITKVISERTVRLIQMSDAAIETSCKTRLAALIQSWSRGQTFNGIADLNRANSEKRRQIEAEKESCYETAEATRKATRQEYRSRIKQMRDESSAVEDQIGQLAAQKASAQVQFAQQNDRLKASLSQAQQQMLIARQRIVGERSAAQALAQKKVNEAGEELQKIEDSNKETTFDTKMLGAKPRGEKTAADANQEWLSAQTKIDSMLGEDRCKKLALDLNHKLKVLQNPGTPDRKTANDSTSKSRTTAEAGQE